MMAEQQPHPGRHHFLLVCFPIQSHINPALRLARRLTSLGVRVTFSTAIHGHRRMFPDAGKDCSLPLPDANDMLLYYHPYSDGFDDGLPTPPPPPEEYTERLHHCGTETLRAIACSTGQQHPFTCLIYTLFMLWAAQLARDICLPSVHFWIQPASVFVVYYHYFHEYRAAIDGIHQNLLAAADNHEDDTPTDGAAHGDGRCRLRPAVDLPGLPRLESRDLPSFLVTLPASNGAETVGDGESRTSDAATSTADDRSVIILREFCRSYRILDEELAATATRPKVLVNTFVALERHAVVALAGVIDVVPIGMVIPPACTDPRSSAPTASDLFNPDNKADYLGWLDRWPRCSVVYIAFGSYSVMEKTQVDEFLKALGTMGRPFLWVVRKDAPAKPDEAALGGTGKLVAWCDQVEVLRHGSVGCFVTHCGWNSTSEAIAAGVPIVAVPQWTDQPMNARLVEGVWRCGVRAACDHERVVRAEELERCVELVMGDGEQGAAIRRAAAEWSEMARAAVNEGGTSDRNLRAFVDGFGLGI